MNDRTLPAGCVPVRRTPTWSLESVPPALLDLHHTTVWAELVVEAGSVEFREIGEAGDRVVSATVDRRVVIEPGRRHRIAPSADARFHVQFYESGGRG